MEWKLRDRTTLSNEVDSGNLEICKKIKNKKKEEEEEIESDFADEVK